MSLGSLFGGKNAENPEEENPKEALEEALKEAVVLVE